MEARKKTLEKVARQYELLPTNLQAVWCVAIGMLMMWVCGEIGLLDICLGLHDLHVVTQKGGRPDQSNHQD